MGKNSNVQWCDHTWNVARGCNKVDEDCKFCYMYRESLNSTRYNPLQVTRTKTVFNLPLRLKEPAKIFTSSLTDFFHPDIDSYRAGHPDYCQINCLNGQHTDMGRPWYDVPVINWVIVGGESGNDNGKYRYRPCELEWIESIIHQCWKHRVPVFVKQLGTHLAKQLNLSDRHGGNMDEWPPQLQIRLFPGEEVSVW